MLGWFRIYIQNALCICNTTPKLIIALHISKGDDFCYYVGEHNHMLRNDLVRLPVVSCEFGEMNAKYQMHLRLRNLANPEKQQFPNIEITADTLRTSIHCFLNI